MFKRILSLLCTIFIFVSVFPVAVFAESHKHTFGDNKRGLDMGSLPSDYAVPVTFYETPCSEGCGYSQYSWTFCGASSYFVDKSGLSALTVYSHYRKWFDDIYGKNSNAKKIVTTGGASGGRNPPSGYTSDGVPSVDNAGLLTWQPTLPDDLRPFNYYSATSSFTSITNTTGSSSSPATMNLVKFSDHVLLRLYPAQNASTLSFYRISYSQRWFEFKAPISGYYSSNSIKSVSSVDCVDSSQSWSNFTYRWSVHSAYFNKDSTISLEVGSLTPIRTTSSGTTKVITNVYMPVFTIEPYESIVTKQTNITINNNVWSGNIYQDTTNNLTYIYPQYTTINEAGDTVTNISENPIIYNSETNQYYTYDSTTNNYYYITYVTAPDPTATPAPSASPDPGASPTPTPAPGGDSGSTSGLMEMLQAIKDSIVQGFADLTANIKLSIENLNINIKNYFDKKLPDQSTPETAQPTPTPTLSVSPEPSVAPSAAPSPSGSPDASPSPLPDSGTPTPAPSGGSSNISGGDDEGLFGWLWDLLKDLLKSILKKIFGLLSSLLGFLIWCVERVTLLVPFLPGPAVAALSAGVVLIFVIKLIRFIRG